MRSSPRAARAVANRDSVADWKAAAALVEQAVDAFGDLHILVNNAGVLRDKMSFNMEEADWDLVVGVHLKGHFCPSRHAGVYWRGQAKAGATVGRRIVNTTSEAGLFGSAGQANYSSAKAGIVGLTWVFAREYQRYGVTANAIAPRARTQMTENMAMFAAPESGFDRFAPSNVSRVVAWLASDDAAEVSGQVFIVIGGDCTWLVASGSWVRFTGTRRGRWTNSRPPRARCSGVARAACRHPSAWPSRGSVGVEAEHADGVARMILLDVVVDHACHQLLRDPLGVGAASPRR
jgi:NAD(P)-dependent dehydrogenase (short-subunit alcohol dehydrogenase family)